MTGRSSEVGTIQRCLGQCIAKKSFLMHLLASLLRAMMSSALWHLAAHPVTELQAGRALRCEGAFRAQLVMGYGVGALATAGSRALQTKPRLRRTKRLPGLAVPCLRAPERREQRLGSGGTADSVLVAWRKRHLRGGWVPVGRNQLPQGRL